MWLYNADFLSGNETRRWLLIAVRHVHLYFVKRSMSESVAMFPVWKIHCWCDVTSGVSRGSSQGIKLSWREPTGDYRGPTSQHSKNVRTDSESRCKITGKTPKNFRKTQKKPQQPTENQKNINTDIQAKWGPFFNLACQGGRFASLPPVSNATDWDQCAWVPTALMQASFHAV